MKENKMMRVASALLVAVLLTTCAISGTFAKYVTSGTDSDHARVAKFGVTVEGTGGTFQKTYTKDGKITVASTEDDVVAPGTSGSLAAFTITGTPEVAVRVSFNGALELGDGWVSPPPAELIENPDGLSTGSTSSFYCPIKITVGEETINGLDFNSANDFETKVNSAIKDYTKDYEAGTDLSAIGTESAPNISWEWAFEGDDVKDTYLGNNANIGDEDISLNITVTVTQID